VSGTLVAPSTAGALAGALSAARGDRERLARMGAAGRAFVLAHCDVGRMCEEYASVYRSASGANH